ncbi:MAG: LacI family DNA-binding transcriptional regulator [Candidatus Sumerlaeota bacterium]|nr:LacI family DNA-binding transcriptional regulator [Candidatus Sumerlaeota bacterium]
MPREKKLTIRDIARLAGVSRSTVSLAINDSPLINDRTKAKVLKIIEEVGYRPNAMARGLVSDTSGAISVVVPPVGHVFSDWYFAESLSGILDAASAADFRVAIEIATEDFKSGRRAVQQFEERRTDGLLAVGALVTDDYLERLLEAGRPVMLVNSELGRVPAVIADNVEGTVAIVHHLASLRHRAIAYIKGLDITTTGRHRDEGFRKGLQLAGLPFRDDLTAFGDFTEASGYEAMGQLLDRKPLPTAVFAMNDMMAIGAARRMKEHGLLPGRDIALVGGDDAPLARYVEPPLTTLRQSMYDLGAEAARLLLKWIRTKQPPPPRTLLHTELIIRESCGARLASARRGGQLR